MNPYQLTGAEDILRRKRPDELIEWIVFEHTFLSLIGDNDSFKSFLLLDWYLCIASDYDWQGFCTKHGHVIYVPAEAPEDLPERLQAWPHVHPSASLDRWHVVEAVPDLCGDGTERLIDTAKSLPEPPVLIAIDGASACMAGRDENDYLPAVVDACTRIVRATGAALALIHHTGWKSKRQRGPKVLQDRVSTEIIVTAERDRLRQTLTCGKMRMARRFEKIVLKGSVVPAGPGKTSLVFSRIPDCDKDANPEIRVKPVTPAESSKEAKKRARQRARATEFTAGIIANGWQFASEVAKALGKSRDWANDRADEAEEAGFIATEKV